MSDPRGTQAFRRLREQVLRHATHCHVCGGPLYPWLKAPHPMSSTVDHVVECDRAPGLALDLANLRPCHARCNSRRGARYGNRKRGRVTQARASRAW